MTIQEALEQRKAEVQQRFDDLSKQKIDIDDEMKRLQGEYRVIEDLLNQEVTVTTPHKKQGRIRKVVEADAEA